MEFFAWDVVVAAATERAGSLCLFFTRIIHRHRPSLAQQQLLALISGGTRDPHKHRRHLPFLPAYAGTNQEAARATVYWLMYSASIA